MRRILIALTVLATAASSSAFASAAEAATVADREVTYCIVNYYGGVPFLDCITIIYPDDTIIVT